MIHTQKLMKKPSLGDLTSRKPSNYSNMSLL